MPGERSFRRPSRRSPTRILCALLGEKGRQEGASPQPEPIPHHTYDPVLPATIPQYYFVIIITAHPRIGCAYARELTVLALLGVPSIPGSFEFRRPPRTAEDVAKYMNRDPPFKSLPRRFGQTITGVLPEPASSLYAASLVSQAESLRLEASLSTGDAL